MKTKKTAAKEIDRRRIVLTVKLKPKIHSELKQIAATEDERTGAYARKVIEAAAKNLVYCRACGFAHKAHE